MLVLPLLFACLRASPLVYDLPETTDHISLRGGQLSLNADTLGEWRDVDVHDGVHTGLLAELRKLEGHDKVLIEEPEDTPGHILPILLGTVYKAGRTELAITATASPVMPGPIVFEEVEVALDPCPEVLDPEPRWVGEMQPTLAFSEVFERVISVQDAGMPHFPVKVRARCIPPVGDSPSSP